MLDLVQNGLDGIMIGAAYALLGLGFTLIFGVMRRLNLAYGPSLMVGAFAGMALHLYAGASALLVVPVTIVGAVLAGLYVERLSFWAVRSDAAVASMVSSFALWMQIEEALALLFPDRTYPFPALPDVAVNLGPFYLRGASLVNLAVAAMVTGGLVLLLYRTRFGLALRAVTDNAAAARLAGINAQRISLLAFALASGIGGIAACLIAATDGQINTHMGLAATYKGLIAMMLGGLGSVPGAVAGGLLLGIVEANALWYLGPTLREISAYGLLLLVLLAWPGGITGGRRASGPNAAAAEE